MRTLFISATAFALASSAFALAEQCSMFHLAERKSKMRIPANVTTHSV
jgi:hypothetical protein